MLIKISSLSVASDVDIAGFSNVPIILYPVALISYCLVIGLMPLHSIQESTLRVSDGFATDSVGLVNRLAVHFVCVLDSLGVDDKMIKDGDLVFLLITSRCLRHGPELRNQIVVDDQDMRVAVAGEIPVGDPHRPAGVDGVGEVVPLPCTDGAEGGPFLAGDDGTTGATKGILANVRVAVC